jgi:glucose/arabinose dehydrogenase
LAAVAVLMLATSCGGSQEPSPAPGVITVRGTERLGWSQVGEVAALRFRAYVDDRPVDLDAATCDGSTPEAACISPLPPLTNGIHTIALVAVDRFSGLESERSVPITVQKVSSTATIGAASFTAPGAGPGPLRLETVVATSDGLAFVADTVLAGVKAPAQLAWAPDGRLFVAEADGRVRVVRPGDRGLGDQGQGEPALDARALLEPPPVGPLGLALHPDFPRNHFVYVSFLAQNSRDRTLLRILRLREVGDALGEPATLFEAPLIATAAEGHGDEGDGAEAGSAAEIPRDGPRLAFGPDRLLYVALPPGIEFDDEPAASTPHASMLRLRDDGRVPLDMAALSGVVAHPIAFDWHPSTGALWAVFPGDGSEAVLRPVTEGYASGVAEAGRATLRVAAGGARRSGVLLFQRTPESRRGPARALVALPENEALSVVRLAEPVRAEDLLAGMFGRIGDVVAGDGGTLFLATKNAERARNAAGTNDDVVVRLTSRAR